MSEVNHKMKVFSRLYVGFRKKELDEEVPLAFATPYEDNQAFRKRQETVDRWAKGYGNKKPRIEIVENTPRPGFKITDDVKRRYWGGGNVVFRVFDPYGFELEIQSQNLMMILLSSGVLPSGIIPGNCLWGRDGANNVLIHESSEEYKSALLAAETLKKPSHINPKTNSGATYILQDGSTGIFLGKFWVAALRYLEREERIALGIVPTAQAQQLDPVELYDAVKIDKRIVFYKKAPFIKHVADNFLFDIEAARIVETTEEKQFASTSKKGYVAYVSQQKPKALKFSTIKWTQAEFNKRLQYFNSSQFHDAAHFFYHYNKVIGVINNDNYYSNTFYDMSYSYNQRIGKLTINGTLISEETQRSSQSLFDGTLSLSLPNKTDAETWFRKLFDEGKLFTLIIEEDNT